MLALHIDFLRGKNWKRKTNYETRRHPSPSMARGPNDCNVTYTAKHKYFICLRASKNDTIKQYKNYDLSNREPAWIKCIELISIKHKKKSAWKKLSIYTLVFTVRLTRTGDIIVSKLNWHFLGSARLPRSTIHEPRRKFSIQKVQSEKCNTVEL